MKTKMTALAVLLGFATLLGLGACQDSATESPEATTEVSPEASPEAPAEPSPEASPQ